MIQQPKSTSLYQSEILAALVDSGIRQLSPGAKARAFCDIVGDRLGELETRQYVNLSQTLLPYATGDSLDFLGQIFGVDRISRQDVVSPSTEGNFQFYVRRGTFGSINNGQDIVIPSGTRIYTDSTTGPVYIANEVTLPASASVQSFSAVSVQTGSSGNAASGVFTKHSFTNYADARFGTLLVTNLFGLIGGRDAEDDDSYRYRINLYLRSKGGSADTDLRLAILRIPGIQDLALVRQAGSFTVYVYGISPSVPPSLLQSVQTEVDSISAFPSVGLVLAPDLIGVSLTTSVKLSTGISSADAPGVLAIAEQAAEDYINNLRVGQTLVLNELADAILNSDSRIVDIGDPNKPLQEIFLWRSRADGSRYSRFLVGNYTPITGERVVVESTTAAVNLTLA